MYINFENKIIAWAVCQPFIISQVFSTMKLCISLFSITLRWEGIKEFHHHLNHDLIQKVTIRKGNVSFFSEMRSILILSLTWSSSNSNFFQVKFMFKWADIDLFTISLHIGFRFLSQECIFYTSNNAPELRSLQFLLKLF